MRSFIVLRLGRGLVGVDVSGRSLYRWGESGGWGIHWGSYAWGYVHGGSS